MFGDAVRGLARAVVTDCSNAASRSVSVARRAVAMFADAVGRVGRVFRDDALERREPFGQRPGRAVALLRRRGSRSRAWPS